MGNRIYYQDRQSIKHAINQINLSIHSQRDAINNDGVHTIEFIDSNYLNNKGGFTTIKIIIISYLRKVQSILSFWEILKDGEPLIFLDFINDNTKIYMKDKFDDIIINDIGDCCTDNIDLNLNNFASYLEMQVYDKITIEQLYINKSTQG